jgi:hypothetical protein
MATKNIDSFLSNILSAGAEPQECDHTDSDVGSGKQIKNPKVDARGDPGFSITYVVLERGTTHGTLGKRFGSSQQKETNCEEDYFNRAQFHL